MGYVPEAYLLYLPKEPKLSSWWFSYTIKLDDTGEVMPNVDESLLNPLHSGGAAGGAGEGTGGGAGGGGTGSVAGGSKGEVVSIPSATPDANGEEEEENKKQRDRPDQDQESAHDLGQGQDPLGLSLAEALYKRGDRVHYRQENNQLVPATIVDVIVLKARDGDHSGMGRASQFNSMEFNYSKLFLGPAHVRWANL